VLALVCRGRGLSAFKLPSVLDHARQRRAHHVVEVGSGEAEAAELQLGDEAPEEDAALLYR
jgi:hypothetical protein